MDYLVNLSLLSPQPELDARLAPPASLSAARWRRSWNSRPAGYARNSAPSGPAKRRSPFRRQPPSCFLATRSGKLIGFACYDSIARGFFGPTGVDQEARGAGIGRALLLATLLDMRTLGYGYAIIGDCRAVAVLRADRGGDADTGLRARRLCRPAEAEVIGLKLSPPMSGSVTASISPIASKARSLLPKATPCPAPPNPRSASKRPGPRPHQPKALPIP